MASQRFGHELSGISIRRNGRNHVASVKALGYDVLSVEYGSLKRVIDTRRLRILTRDAVFAALEEMVAENQSVM